MGTRETSRNRLRISKTAFARQCQVQHDRIVSAGKRDAKCRVPILSLGDQMTGTPEGPGHGPPRKVSVLHNQESRLSGGRSRFQGDGHGV